MKGFAALLQYRLAARDGDGTVELAFEIGPEHRNASGGLHGGVIISLLDAACREIVAADGGSIRSVPLQTTVSYVRAVAAGPVRVLARRVGGGKSVFSATAELYDAGGALCALGQGSYRI